LSIHKVCNDCLRLVGLADLICYSLARSRPIRAPGRKYKRKFLRRSHAVGDGSIDINVRSRTLKHIMNDTEDHEDYKGSDSEVFEVFEGEITFLPNSVPNTRISVSFEQRSTYQGSLLGKPTISFSATLPDNSEVFLRIKDGDMEGLLQLLARGAASLTDRDSIGRSLLNVRILILTLQLKEAALTVIVCHVIRSAKYLQISCRKWR